MEYLVTAEEMKQYDANTIEKIGIPGMVLMERAALAAYAVLEEYFRTFGRKKERILIVAGTGNNGGDGLALARLLSESNQDVAVKYVGNEKKASEQWKQQRRLLEFFYVGTDSSESHTEYTVIVDALFGVGLSRPIEGEYAAAVRLINESDAFKLSLDVPSGIHSDTGEVLGCAVKADKTVTFGFCKRGLVLYPGADFAGQIVTADIGITERSFLGRIPKMFVQRDGLKELLPKRSSYGNKGTFGKVLLAAGNEKMAGAAVLAAKAAYRSGAGMVKVISHSDNRGILLTAVPEALFGTWEELEAAMDWADVIAIGPGIGNTKEAAQLMKKVISDSSLPLVIDADGLNILAADAEMKEALAAWGSDGRKIVLTPHTGELARLLGKEISGIKGRLWEYGSMAARQLNAVVAAKDARTFICEGEKPVCVNVRGSSAMATAGSGDVLTGIIAGLLAQGMEAFAAARTGVLWHAMAGEAAAVGLGEYACRAGDIIDKMTSA